MDTFLEKHKIKKLILFYTFNWCKFEGLHMLIELALIVTRQLLLCAQAFKREKIENGGILESAGSPLSRLTIAVCKLFHETLN